MLNVNEKRERWWKKRGSRMIHEESELHAPRSMLVSRSFPCGNSANRLVKNEGRWRKSRSP